MNVQRLMIVRVKLKNKTEEYKYGWQGFFYAKIGNIFITSKLITYSVNALAIFCRCSADGAPAANIGNGNVKYKHRLKHFGKF